ncbi:MAG TPA: exodeoxyribonuclease V subunit alpha, partial [Rudaea sp.]|uniref:exodeoxyribonuclease V subunit alpha n=1 Tax=Rudaea sp. TaxID=2136325 RepID=UPI002F92A5C5
REQRIAALLAVRSRFLLITGGPGTGKTTTVLRLLAMLIEQAFAKGEVPPRIALAAPTGKAAARLSETLRTPLAQANAGVLAALPTSASTVHRLIGLSAGQQARYHGGRPLPFDLVVVDEASMLDLALAARLCAALAPDARLILLGDRDQLASVETGSVFGALCAAAGATNRYSPTTATMLQKLLGAEVESSVAAAPLTDALVELRHSHRFTAASAIGRFARALREGAYARAQDVLEECALELQTRMVAERDVAASLVRQFAPRFASLAQAPTPEIALNQLDRFRVLCALRSGPCGAETINALIEQELRRSAVRDDGPGWFAGRLVMIASNDPRQGLFNGDIGIALPSGDHGAFEVWFRSADGGMLRLAPALLPAHRGAFALTVHKAQGSEFDEVLVVLPAHDARVLSRELLYTAVTRARKKVELWTSPQILETTIARTTRRWSGLAEKLGTQA